MLLLDFFPYYQIFFYDYAPFIYLRIHFLNVHLFLHVNYYLGT
jgi:hypothetical protein